MVGFVMGCRHRLGLSAKSWWNSFSMGPWRKKQRCTVRRMPNAIIESMQGPKGKEADNEKSLGTLHTSS